MLQVLAGIGLLVAAAEVVVRAGSALGLRLGLSRLWIGLTVVALGTSAPELVVSVGATLNGQGSMALGNVVGSNILNILVVLGLTAVIVPVSITQRAARQDIPIVSGVGLLVLFLAWRGVLDLWAGILLLAVAVAYTAYLHRRERATIEETADMDAWERLAAGWLVVIVLVSIGTLLIGGRLVLAGATTLAASLGWSEDLIGLTVVAVGTSLPELAVSLAAALRQKVDLAIGNLVGSNVLNLTLVLGSAAVAGDVVVPTNVLLFDLPVMVGVGLLLWRSAWTGMHVSRWEGFAMLGFYGAYIVALMTRPIWSFT